MGSNSKDYGSMKMDELLKRIWTAEEIQTNNTAMLVSSLPFWPIFGRQQSASCLFGSFMSARAV
ncbi:hypothetical protein Hanom_Chr01g00076621 [Helianthus anomalus]